MVGLVRLYMYMECRMLRYSSGAPEVCCGPDGEEPYCSPIHLIVYIHNISIYCTLNGMINVEASL